MAGNRAHHLFLLTALGAALFLVNLGATRLWDEDEAIFSATSLEMYERGELLVPYFNGQLFAHKPPLLYWSQIAAFHIFGPHEFAARIGPALFGIGNMLLVYSLGSMLFGRRAGLWAGIVLGSSVNFAVISRAATPDSFLIFFTMLSVWILVRNTGRFEASQGSETPWRPSLPPTWGAYALSYASMGVAVLVKGPIGVLLPTAVWGLFLLFEQRHQARLISGGREWPKESFARWLAVLLDFLRAFRPWYVLQTTWRMRPLTGVAMVLLVAGPWYAWVGLATEGLFLREFFGVHNLGRFTSPMENHRGPFFYYLPAILLGAFPWSILLGPALAHLACNARAGSSSRAGLALCLAWIAVWVGFFSLASTKLPSYVVPAYPAIALILGACVARWLETLPGTSRAWLRAAYGVCALGGIAILVAVPIASRYYLAGEVTPALVGCVLIGGAIVGLALSEAGRLRLSLASLAGTSVLFCTWLLAFSVLPIDAHQNSEEFAAVIRARTRGERANVGALRYLPPSFVFYTGRPVAGLWTAEAALAHFEEHPRDAFIFTTEENYQRLQNRLPHDVTVLAKDKRFLRKGQLVLLGRESDSAAALSLGRGIPATELKARPR